MNPLIQAIKNNNLNQLKLLIEMGGDVNVRDEYGNSLLHIAAEMNALECAELLIDHGLDVNNSRSLYNETPVYAACWHGNVEIVRFMLLRGGDISLKRYDDTPFQEISKENTIKLLQCLKINEVINTNSQKEIIKWALYGNYINFLKGVFLDGFDVNIELEHGNRPIHIATAELTAMLINLGADTNIKNYYGSTPLHAALSGSGGYINIRDIDLKKKDKELKINLLLKSNVALESSDNELCTPLHLACEYSLRDEHMINVAQILIDQGVSLEARDINGQTPLYWLIDQTAKRLFHYEDDHNYNLPAGYFKLIKTLIDKGCNINTQNSFGQTPLLSLFTLKQLGFKPQLHKYLLSFPLWYLRFIAFFIKAGADINAEDHSGTTPLIACAKNELFAGYTILLENGADENKKNQFGETAIGIIKTKTIIRKSELLYIAIKYQNLFLIKLVLESGIDINEIIYKKRNRTPLFFAIEFYHPQIFELLILNGARPELLPPAQQKKCAVLLNQLKARIVSAILQSLTKRQIS